ncbi:carboxypeptidase-like regulatory domain-containing protein [Maribacter spongiicola]|nr:carboxypeptidase-like regulatory domain-containing protein [Maribacter spongiicola]
MRSRLLIFFFFMGVCAFAQTGDYTKLEGRVNSDDGDVAATHVLNLTSNRASITDENGYFSIPVRLLDTLEFSAIQYKKKIIVVSTAIYESKLISVGLEEALTELDEVTVTPYNLSGNLLRDLPTLDLDPVVTASTLGLPNAYVKIPTKAERELQAATANPIMSMDALLNGISGRTKMLKNRVERNNLYNRTERVRDFYADSVYVKQLLIPLDKIDDFLYYCEVDPRFQEVVDTHSELDIWEYLRKKSLLYREYNALD